MKRLFFVLILVLNLILLTQSAIQPSTRRRRDMEALERIMKEMVENGGMMNGPGFRPGR
ncbi:hypothetical protein Angca_000288 [Angiostrongylus cantonensis]|nr:hypothetical protein Angca_000288 [Angiostrongylus cantonensis]